MGINSFKWLNLSLILLQSVSYLFFWLYIQDTFSIISHFKWEGKKDTHLFMNFRWAYISKPIYNDNSKQNILFAYYSCD